MILKGHSIGSAGDWLSYCTQPGKIYEIMHTDGLDVSSMDAMLSDLQLFENPRLKKPFLSLILSPDRDLDNDKLILVIEDLRKELKLTDNQMIAITHAEKRNMKHVHLLFNRVDFNDKTYNDSFIGGYCTVAASEVAKKHGLTDVRSNRYSENKIFGAKEFDGKGSEHKKKAAELITIVKDILKKPDILSIEDVFGELHFEHHVDVTITKHKNGSYGVKLNHDGNNYKASQISRLLTLSPDGDTYGPNKAMKNYMKEKVESITIKTIELKTIDQIHAEFMIHNNYDVFQNEMATLKAIYMGGINKSKTNEEKEAEFLRKKYDYRPKITFQL
ncbi:MAG: hypothetical protein RL308_2611 [Bacteroidota bacterium]|jgi:hypothetical protein